MACPVWKFYCVDRCAQPLHHRAARVVQRPPKAVGGQAYCDVWAPETHRCQLSPLSLKVLEGIFAGLGTHVSTGGPIARAPEAIGRSGVLCGVRRRCRCRHRRHIVVGSVGGRCAGAIRRRRGHGWQGRRSAVWGAGGGGCDSATSVAVGIEASTPGGTASTVVCAGANTSGGRSSHGNVAVGIESRTPSGTASTGGGAGANPGGGGSSHVVITVGIKASTPVGTASCAICTGANNRGGGASHGTVRSYETSSSACIVCTGVGAGSSSKGTREGIGASHGIVAARIDARSSAGTASTVVCTEASPPSLW